MSLLAELLDVEGTRLTGVNLNPPRDEPHDGWVAAALMRMDLTDLHEARAVAGAIATLMGDACLVLHGQDDAGQGWIAPIILAGAPLEAEDIASAAGAQLARALILLGLDTGGATVDLQDPIVVTEDELAEPYRASGHPVRALRDWSVVDLVHGLVLELIIGDLDQVVEEFTEPSLDRSGGDRRDVLSRHLGAWASHQKHG